MGVVTVAELKPSMSGKRSARPNSGARTEWPISDVPSELRVEVGTSSFALPKFPLASRSGRIRKLLVEAKESKISRLNLSGVPGGSEAFELAAKFCCGMNVEISLSNVAMLRCAAGFLEMTEEISEKNLETRAEVFLKETIFPDISNSISVLHSCEALLPVSEDVNLVGRLIGAIANNACKEQLTLGLSKLEHKQCVIPETTEDWWGEKLAQLNLDFFQRVVSAVRAKGLKQDIISRILINYAHNSLLVKDNHCGKGYSYSYSNSYLDLDSQRKRRITVETIVGLLPTRSRKSTVPIAFLSSLLKSAIAASAPTPCRSDLERRISLQLDQAILEDILIPANPHGNNHNPLYDTDSVARIFSFFLNLEEGDEEEDNNVTDEAEMVYDFDSHGSPKHSSILKVSKLLDNYLAEVALDSNLTPARFVALTGLLPDHARLVHDGLYQAVDIFLKVHPNIKDSERYTLCKTIDCQKLSQEACSHAAQNERLPVQTAVQVLYFEQMRLRNALNGGHNQTLFGSLSSQMNQFPHRSGSSGGGAGSGFISPRDNYASVRRENRELKLEVARMRMRLTDLEKDQVCMKQEMGKPHPANRLLRRVTRTLSRLNVLFRIRDYSDQSWVLFQKRRRHSGS